MIPEMARRDLSTSTEEDGEPVIVSVRMDRGTRKRWKVAAAREGMGLSAWIRRAGDRALETESKLETIRKVALS